MDIYVSPIDKGKKPGLANEHIVEYFKGVHETYPNQRASKYEKSVSILS